MPTPLDPKRVPTLKAALDRFQPDELVPQRELATIYGVSPARFSSLIKTRFEGFPPGERRGDKTNWFPAHAALKIMIAYADGKGNAKQEQARKVRDFLSAKEDAAPVQPVLLTPAELDKLASAETRAFQLAKMKGDVIPRSQVRETAQGIYQRLARFMASLPHEIDPNGQLNPKIRADLEKRCNATHSAFYEDLKNFLEASDDDDDA